jgi:hypothetical protein
VIKIPEDVDNASFIRHWAERAYDQVQLAQIAAIEQVMIDFAMHGWRSVDKIEPPYDVPLICASGDVLVIMSQNRLGEWRTSQGLPHKPPRAWMPCPALPAH